MPPVNLAESGDTIARLTRPRFRYRSNEGNWGRLDYHNVLLENGFGEIPIELVTSFNKAHESVSLKYNGVSEKGEWGGTYNEKFDGMHIGLKSSFIEVLTKK